MNLEQTIVLWLNKYLDQQIKSFESLSDGCVFSELLNEVDPMFFSLQNAKNIKVEPDNQKIQRLLIDILEKIQQYRANIQCKPPDYIEIDVQEITISKNTAQILALFELILKVILSSSMRGRFIEPILQLEEKDQEILMHFLKNHLDESENQNNDWSEENYLQTLVQKMDELENLNTELKSQINEQEEKNKNLKTIISEYSTQLENKDIEIRALTESKYHLEKCLEEKMDFQNEYKESEKLKQKCLEQEHKLAVQELTIEDFKKKEQQFNQLKEEYQQMKQQVKEIEKLETKIESLQERREFDKDVYQKTKERYEKEINNLKSNMKELLLQQSELKEGKLNLELELQQKQARYERQSEQIKQIENEQGQKIKELQNLLETLHSADEEIQNQNTPTNNKLSSEMKLSVNLKSENFEREYYIKENHKLEEKIKELQLKINELQMEEESKNQKKEFESQLQQSQQISLLTDKIKQFQEHNQQLKKQNEELKKLTQNKKVNQVDYEISVLSLLSEALQKKLKDYSNKEVDQ